MTTFTERDTRGLLELMRLDTTTPMETGRPSEIPEAMSLIADLGNRSGLAVVYAGTPTREDLEDVVVPTTVAETAASMGESFFESQPNLVLQLGPDAGPERTLVFNFHVDTVGGGPSLVREGDRIRGRGVVDALGPGVAVMAGIRAAVDRLGRGLERTRILVEAVSGEEGGAMGVYGTRKLVNAGYVGRLNVFAEPSEGFYMDESTTSMTARITVAGTGSTDDHPTNGHNATLLLGALAETVGLTLGPVVRAAGGKLCVAGLHTGTMHNRVYGTGSLQLNVAYPDGETALELESALEDHFERALERFAERFAGVEEGRRAARDCRDITRLQWTKRRLPVLRNRNAEMEAVLDGIGLSRNPAERANRAFTCDAMWAQGPGLYTVVFGPGSLEANGAHTDHEHVTVQDLDRYAAQVARLVEAFATRNDHAG